MSPLCSRNARLEKALVGRAQWGTHPGHPRNVHEQAWKDHLRLLAAALLNELFEQPAGSLSSCVATVLARCVRSNEEMADPFDVRGSLRMGQLGRAI